MSVKLVLGLIFSAVVLFITGSGVFGNGETGISDVCCVSGAENTGAGSGSVVLTGCLSQ